MSIYRNIRNKDIISELINTNHPSICQKTFDKSFDVKKKILLLPTGPCDSQLVFVAVNG